MCCCSRHLCAQHGPTSTKLMIHDLSPVAFYLGSIPIKWYPLAYIISIIAGFFYIKFVAKAYKLNLSYAFMDDLFCWTIVGIIIGGRLGHVIFYDLSYYLKHPTEIVKTWHGGMSFHGGLFGFIIAATIVAKKHKINPWIILDLSACVVPLGLFLGRIANFINGELFGRATTLPWGVVFNNTGGGNELRHPSQIYEALTEGLLLFIIMNALLFFTKARLRAGLLSGIFSMLYSIFRFIIEYFKNPDDDQIGFAWLTMGQILSIVTFILFAGITLVRMNNMVQKRSR